MTINYVVGFMFDDDGRRVVLLTKLKPAWQNGLLNGIGGKIEPDENPFNAMVREFREETGVETFRVDWTEFCRYRFNFGEDTGIINFFVGFNTKRVNNVRSIEAEQVGVYDADHFLCDRAGFRYVQDGLQPSLPVISNLRFMLPMAMSMLVDRERTPVRRFDVTEVV